MISWLTKKFSWRQLRKIASTSLLISVITFHSVGAIDVDFFATNDVLFYDPTLCTLTNQNGDIALVGNDVAEKVFRFLTTTPFSGLENKPFNALQAAGALGNFQQESSMNPGALQDPGTGIGLAQWSSDNDNPRKGNLLSLAFEMGKPWQDLEVQLTMIRNEINAGYGKSLLNRGFNNVSTPQEASYVFQVIYEGAGKPEQAKRDNAAIGYYQAFKDLAPGSTPIDLIVNGNQCSSAANSGSASAYADDGFKIYNQFDPKWGNLPYGSATIAQAGCGPSAMAMIITALTGKEVTPVETTAYADKRGMYTAAGSSWAIAPVVAENWGLKAKNIPRSVSAVNEVLRNGGLVVTSGSGASPFTSGGHYIMIRGVTPNGNWKIGDSNGNKGIENSKKEWTPEHILSIANAGNVVAITK